MAKTLDQASFNNKTVWDNVNETIERVYRSKQLDLEKMDLNIIIKSVEDEIDHIETTLQSIVKRQTGAMELGTRDLDCARCSIKELFEEFQEIDRDSQSTAQLMNHVLIDIAALDNANRNVSECIRVLKNHQMLVHVVDRLKSLISTRNYRDMGQILQIERQVIPMFENVDHDEKLNFLLSQHRKIHQDLEHQIQQEFEESFSFQGLLIGKHDRIQSACLVVDLMGETSRKILLRIYSRIQLRESRTLVDHRCGSCLEDLVRRRKWFEDRLNLIASDHYQIFPENWNVYSHLFDEFSRIIRESLVRALESVDVTQIPTLKKQVDGFESMLRSKYKVHSTILSDTIDPFLSALVDENSKKLTNLLESFNGEAISLENTHKVVSSCFQLVEHGSESFRSIMELSRNRPLVDMGRSIVSHFLKYSQHLENMNQYVINTRKLGMNNKIVSLCFIVNTCSYALNVINQLEEKLWQSVHPLLVDKHLFETIKLDYDELSRRIMGCLGNLLYSETRSILDNVCHWKTGRTEAISMIYSSFEKDVLTVDGSLTEFQDFQAFFICHCRIMMKHLYNTMCKAESISGSEGDRILENLDGIRKCILGTATRTRLCDQIDWFEQCEVWEMFGEVELLVRMMVSQQGPTN